MECGKNPQEGKIHENGVNCGRFRAIRDARGLLAVREQVEKQADVTIHSESSCSLAYLSYTRDSQVQISCETGRRGMLSVVISGSRDVVMDDNSQVLS